MLIMGTRIAVQDDGQARKAAIAGALAKNQMGIEESKVKMRMVCVMMSLSLLFDDVRVRTASHQILLGQPNPSL